jgi:hypothetical protein
VSWWGIGQHVLLAGVAVTVAAVAGGTPAPPPAVQTVFTFQDPAITESSGIVRVGDRVLTHNDSGDGPYVYVVDPSSGKTVGRTTYSSDAVTDVEAMAAGPGGSVWMGDIGDNDAAREHVSVYRLPPLRDGEHTVDAQRYDLRYPDGPTNAETLLVNPRDGRLLIVSKGLFGGRIYEAPTPLSADRVNLLRPVGHAAGLVTDGSFFPDGRHVVLRTYGAATVYDTATWQSHAGMRLPDQQQGEGITVVDGGRRVLVSSEGAQSPVLSVALTKPMLASAGITSSSPAHDRLTAIRARGRDPMVLAGIGAVVLVGGLGVSSLLRRRRRQRRSTT